MKALILTNEFPPYVYGGAGIHAQYLARELAKLCPVEVRCFGDQLEEVENPIIHGAGWNRSNYTAPENLHSIFGALQRSVLFNTRNIDADVVHLHTWYSHFGGILAKFCYGLPMVLTVHSLEPLRPWKREQLGGGYDFTVWLEKTAIEMADAVVAVSKGTRDDILANFDIPEEKVRIIHNGIDPDEYKPYPPEPDLLRFYGIDPDIPYVFFVGRTTQQKGILHLINAIKYLEPGTQVVFHSRSADTPAMAEAMERGIAEAQENYDGNIVWVKELTTENKIRMYSSAGVFCCPSIYEPFGIINLEAMACEIPVVASEVGGMKEVIRHGETGLMVPLEQDPEPPYDPVDPDQFAKDLAAAINELMADPERRKKMGQAGRQRVLDRFSWSEVAKETLGLYQRVIDA